MTKAICVRLPGRGITSIRAVEQHYSHNYRAMGIDAGIFDGVLGVLLRLSTEFRIVAVPSGAGAFLMSDLARRLGIDDEGVADISRHVVSAQSRLIYRWFLRRIGERSILIEHPSELRVASHDRSVCVVLPSSEYESTDALWAASTYYSDASWAFIFKRLANAAPLNPNILDLGKELDSEWLIRAARSWVSQGGSPLLGGQCLSYLGQSKSVKWILQAEYPHDMTRVVHGLLPLGLARSIVV